MGCSRGTVLREQLVADDDLGVPKRTYLIELAMRELLETGGEIDCLSRTHRIAEPKRVGSGAGCESRVGRELAEAGLREDLEMREQKLGRFQDALGSVCLRRLSPRGYRLWPWSSSRECG